MVPPVPARIMAADCPTVAQILRRQARCRPDHSFLVCDSDRISYA
ncbi:Long-chain-fatty-acid--CoA ligase [Mycobacterium marinum str. Europe]|nr:Long-chain-fatty-acid--CoA ligase [Mycobacterium marinum str. Europe]